MASTAAQRIQGGHLVKITVGEKTVGWARTSNLSQDYGVDAVYALGDIGPVEHTALRWSGQITLDQFFIHKKALADAAQLFDFVPMGPAETMEAGIFNFKVEGRDDEGVILTYEECTATNYTLTQTANQFSGQNATFQARKVTRGPGHTWEGKAGSGLTEAPVEAEAPPTPTPV